jgi:hypothetical protein
MKRILVIALLIAVLLSAAALPPQLPSCFHGTVTGGIAGQVVRVWVGAVELAHTNVILYNGNPVYSVCVPTDGYPNGTYANFKANGVQAGIGRLYPGTSVTLNLVPQMRFFRR